MEFKKFAQFLEERGFNEDANRAAMKLDTSRQMILNRFPGKSVEEIERIISSTGYRTIPELAHALEKDPNVWQRIKNPGQENYVGGKNRAF